MSLHAQLLQRAAEGRPIRVALIGAGKFGSMYLAQVPRTAGIHLVGIADLSPDAARANLARQGLTQVEVRQADAAAQDFAACRQGAPFDAIVLGGSVAEVPPALLSLLAPGGRLAAVVGHEPVMRATIVTRTGEAAFQTAQPWDTVAPRLLNFPAPSRFRF